MAILVALHVLAYANCGDHRGGHRNRSLEQIAGAGGTIIRRNTGHGNGESRNQQS